MSSARQKLIVYLILLVVTFSVYWQVNQYDFVNFDDNRYVINNLNIRSGITSKGIIWAFTTKDIGLWNPLVWLSLMVDYQLFGLQAGGYHLTNLIFHILSTLLLFWLFNRMTGALCKSAFVAALLALHPLHVESVAWIAERKDVLSAFFWMLTLCFYVYYTEKMFIRRYLLVVFSFVMALMSKPMVVTLPLILILLDYWPLERFRIKEAGNNCEGIFSKKKHLWLLYEKIPFFILSIILVIINLFYTPENQITHEVPDEEHFPFLSRLANTPVSFVTYLEKTFWPHDMTFLYPFVEHVPVWQVLVASLIIIAITIFVIVMLKRLPYLFVGWLWYSIAIAPVIGIIQISASTPYAMADRYHYLPSIGIAIMLTWGIAYFFKDANIRKKILFPVGIAFIAAMSIITWKQCGFWKNTATLFNHALQITKDNSVAHNNLGPFLAEEGKIKESIYHYNEAIRIKPYFPAAYNNRGAAYSKLGQYQVAIKDFSKAIQMVPIFSKAYLNRANAYDKLGQHKKAIEDFSKLINLHPYHADFYNKRGVSFAKLGDYQHAITDFNKVIFLQPHSAIAHKNRGLTYFKQGNNNKGCLDAQKACDLGDCHQLEDVKAKGLCR
ncbi:MAG: tetratricopeptide repeat protein [Syntrophaceae bacterium]|nr:tetratricopeptide repeat protein [Syntrophaceae bacterium]